LIKSAIKSGIGQVNSLKNDNCLITQKKQEKEIAVYPEPGKGGLIFNSYGL
jgi:hypothetical protein